MSRETKGHIVEYGHQHGLFPVATPEEVSNAYKQYLAICQAVLIPYDERIVDKNGIVRQESDYARIPQRKKNERGQWITEYKDVPRKSAFRKLARFYGVSTEIIEKERTLHPDTGAVTWHYTIRAWQGQVTTMGEAACSTDESNKQRTEHDAKATAHTRAKNRAISDLIGFGQVSAEEINYTPPENTETPVKTEKQEKRSPGVGPPPKQRKQKSRKVDADANAKTNEPKQSTINKQDRDEEQVINAFKAHEVSTENLIIKKKQGSVWIQHPALLSRHKWEPYQNALDDAELENQYHRDKNAWVVQL